MKEVSNSTLGLFVIAAIVVSVFGTMMSLSKLDQLSGFSGITGAVSQNSSGMGTANLTVPAATFINVSDDNIDFGSLNVELTNSSELIDDWWIIKNDGSVNLSVSIHGTQSGTADGNKPGSGPFTSQQNTTGCLSAYPASCFMVACYNSTADNFTLCNSTYHPLSISTGDAIVEYLRPEDVNDTAWISVNVTVPAGEPAAAGGLSQQVIFTATQQS